MQLHEVGLLRYVTFDSLSDEGISHAAFTRHGGVSPQPWDSLNFGSTVGDDINNVIENKRRAYECLGIDYCSIYDVWQVHSADVVITDNPRPQNMVHQRADIILTDKPDITLLMRFADCVPLLLFDPIKKVIGLAHAGWQGTLKGVATAAISALRSKFCSNPQDIIAVIGPSIGPDHYQVGRDVEEHVKKAFGDDSSSVLRYPDGKPFFNLWLANQIQLENAGVKHIEASRICTSCHQNDWYSHRAQSGQAGRFGVLLNLSGK